MVVNNVLYTDKTDAGTALVAAIFSNTKDCIGEYCGFKLYTEHNPITDTQEVRLEANGKYNIIASQDPLGQITRLNNFFNKKLPEFQWDYSIRISDLNQNIKIAKKGLEISFDREDELRELENRHNEVLMLLSIDTDNIETPKRNSQEDSKENTIDFDDELLAVSESDVDYR